MATDFLTLLRRDHLELQQGLDALLDPAATVVDIRVALDGVRLGLTAHAEAEDIVLYRAIARCCGAGALEALIAEARSGHVVQEQALMTLLGARPGSATWRDRVLHLRTLVAQHAEWEEAHVVAAIRAADAEVYARLAGAFATERMRQLAMLQPSSPVFDPGLAHAS
jgi:hypothetical protein